MELPSTNAWRDISTYATQVADRLTEAGKLGARAKELAPETTRGCADHTNYVRFDDLADAQEWQRSVGDAVRAMDVGSAGARLTSTRLRDLEALPAADRSVALELASEFDRIGLLQDPRSHTLALHRVADAAGVEPVVRKFLRRPNGLRSIEQPSIPVEESTYEQALGQLQRLPHATYRIDGALAQLREPVDPAALADEVRSRAATLVEGEQLPVRFGGGSDTLRAALDDRATAVPIVGELLDPTISAPTFRATSDDTRAALVDTALEQLDLRGRSVDARSLLRRLRDVAGIASYDAKLATTLREPLAAAEQDVLDGAYRVVREDGSNPAVAGLGAAIDPTAHEPSAAVRAALVDARGEINALRDAIRTGGVDAEALSPEDEFLARVRVHEAMSAADAPAELA